MGKVRLPASLVVAPAFVGLCLAGPSLAHADGEPRVELIQNGSFDQGSNHWRKADFYYSYQNGQKAAESTFEVVDNRARLRTTRRGNEWWHAHLLQHGIVLERGRHYELSFWAKVENKDIPSGPVSVVPSLIRGNGDVIVYFEQPVRVMRTGEWEQFRFAFDAPASDDFVRLDMNYGRPPGMGDEPERFDLWLDDVSLAKVGDGVDPRVRTSGIGARTPVQRHGALRISASGQLTSVKTGAPVTLRGVSLHGVQWDHPWYFGNREAILELKRWGADLVRVPVYLGQGGIIQDPGLEATVREIVETALELEMYVIIDWHVHNDAGDPNRYVTQARDFFARMAQRFGQEDAVLFEIANEPNGASWPDIKRYAETIVPVIRAASSNVIIIGTPVWSQEVQLPVSDPVISENIAYTFHFYAASHRLDAFMPKIQAARDAGLAVFVSEWGLSNFDGNGGIDVGESTRWLDFLEARGISWVNWNLSSENESSAILRPGTNPIPSQVGGWSDAQLTPSGVFVRDRLSRP